MKIEIEEFEEFQNTKYYHKGYNLTIEGGEISCTDILDVLDCIAICYGIDITSITTKPL